jgi:hypothetical protein
VRLLKRLAVIVAAFIASAASVVPVFLLFVVVFDDGPSVLHSETFAYAFVAFVLLVALTCLPAAAVIAVAEWRRIRHWFFFAAAGGLTAMLLLLLFGFVQGLHWPGAFLSASLVTSGLVAGLVYWLIAGRSSGALRDVWATRGIAR